MRRIDFFCPNFGKLTIIGSKLHDGHDFVYKSNAKSVDIDFLIFLDSRGVSSGFKSSLADKIVNQVSLTGASYLLICRPVNLTTWATLLNFININELNPSKIITNMGFVDFTPKKLAILEDAVAQVEFAVGKDVVVPVFAESYMTLSEGELDLYLMSYSNEYKKEVGSLTTKVPTVIINTPNVSEDICIDRTRPHAFYIGLNMANEFNRSIENAQVLEIGHFDRSLTYDAVHWTQQGNELIFEKIKGYL